MNYSDGFRYCVMRILLMLGTNAVGIFFGKVLLWVIASVLPASLDSLKYFLIDDKTGSVTAALTMIVLLGLVFYDDGKKHAAYEDWDVFLVLITEIIILVFYFVPVIFYNPSDITAAQETCYYFYYFPCRWLMLAFDCDIKVAAALGMAIILGAMLVLYLISYGCYKKKHPQNFKLSAAEPEEDA